LNLPKSMIRQTGGFSFGATSTRSRPASRARFRASSVAMMPNWAPSAPITRIGVIRIWSLMRCCFSMAHFSRTGASRFRPASRGVRPRIRDGRSWRRPRCGSRRTVAAAAPAKGGRCGVVANARHDDPSGAGHRQGRGQSRPRAGASRAFTSADERGVAKGLGSGRTKCPVVNRGVSAAWKTARQRHEPAVANQPKGDAKHCRKKSSAARTKFRPHGRRQKTSSLKNHLAGSPV